MRIDQRYVREEKAAFNGGPHTFPGFLLGVFSVNLRSLLIPLRSECKSRALRAGGSGGLYNPCPCHSNLHESILCNHQMCITNGLFAYLMSEGKWINNHPSMQPPALHLLTPCQATHGKYWKWVHGQGRGSSPSLSKLPAHRGLAEWWVSLPLWKMWSPVCGEHILWFRLTKGTFTPSSVKC